MVDSSHRALIGKNKIGVCRVEKLNNINEAEAAKNNIDEAEAAKNNKDEEELAEVFNKGLEEIFLFDLLRK